MGGMKILVTGAGVIGTTYAWQLALGGHELAHFVRPGKKRLLEEHGIRIRCLDLRHGRRVESETVYRPAIVDGFAPGDGYDLIVCSVNSNQLAELLPLLGEKSGKTTILFLQNMRPGDDELIDRYLDCSRYVIGYPFKTGGGRNEFGIDTVIFGNYLSNTVLGEKDGRITPRLRMLRDLFAGADMNPKMIRKIVPYVRTHYIWAAASLGAYMKAGSWERFIGPEITRESVLAMREGWKICRQQGINPRGVSPTRFYYLPLRLMVPLIGFMYRDTGMRRMFEGHVGHSPGEMRTMYYDVLEMGEACGIDMPYYRGFKRCVDGYFSRQ
jgi:hypothetical protein